MVNLKFDKKYIKFIVPIFLVIISLSILLTLSLKNNDIFKLSKISKEIIAINDGLKNALDDTGLNYEDSCKILTDGISSFERIDSNLNLLNSNNENFITLKKSLLDYNKLNINLYNSALSILTNKNPNNFSTLYSDLIKNEKDVLNSSSVFKNSKLNVYFPKNANHFFVSLNKYINDLYKENRDNDILISQKLDFLLNMNTVVSDFSTLKEDLKPALNKVKEDNRDLSIILNDINEKRSNFAHLKDKAYSISVPANAKSCYAALEDILSSYETYLNSLEKSIKNEIDASNNTKTDNIKFSFFNNNNSNYDDSFDKYETFLSYFENFKCAIKNYKNS